MSTDYLIRRLPSNPLPVRLPSHPPDPPRRRHASDRHHLLAVPHLHLSVPLLSQEGFIGMHCHLGVLRLSSRLRLRHLAWPGDLTGRQCHDGAAIADSHRQRLLI